jgi:hypothetical protein
VSEVARGAVAAVEAVVEREGEADAILRQAVAELAQRYGAFAGIRFVEEDEMALGPAAGAPAPVATAVPVRFRDAPVAELVTSAALDGDDLAAWQRIAELVAPYCLVGWDTGGEGWEPM